ncbi:MAG: DUF4160 domain-containing protein [Bacteroidetes bacterium]|nr:MAG: DUF4160 domain-containing protein [Bacteroidota bacterium]RLD84808.1 MAG: DUF4160 domain-containing protein [Bacteroidota bacterium]
MSPTIFRFEKYRFFFNSREEERKHVHIATSDGTAKFWLEPIISMANYYNLSSKELKEIMKIVEEKQEEFKNDWNKHFDQ